jgi:DNA/RNA endonuclease G (NUC1)
MAFRYRPVILSGFWTPLLDTNLNLLIIFRINFFKDNGSEKIAIALIMNNQGSGSGLKSFATSIDNIESLTGIDFFSGLSDDIENKLESTINTSS